MSRLIPTYLGTVCDTGINNNIVYDFDSYAFNEHFLSSVELIYELLHARGKVVRAKEYEYWTRSEFRYDFDNESLTDVDITALTHKYPKFWVPKNDD